MSPNFRRPSLDGLILRRLRATDAGNGTFGPGTPPLVDGTPLLFGTLLLLFGVETLDAVAWWTGCVGMVGFGMWRSRGGSRDWTRATPRVGWGGRPGCDMTSRPQGLPGLTEDSILPLMPGLLLDDLRKKIGVSMGWL